MKYQSARNLICEDVCTMPLEKLQRHKVRLLDAARYSEGADGFYEEAVKAGFYLRIVSEYADGYTPRDPFLSHNLRRCYHQACVLEKFILGEKFSARERRYYNGIDKHLIKDVAKRYNDALSKGMVY